MVGVGKLLGELRGDASFAEECKIVLGTRVDFEGCVALFVCAMAFVSMDQIVLNTKRMVRRVVHVHVNANGRRALSPGEVGLIN